MKASHGFRRRSQGRQSGTSNEPKKPEQNKKEDEARGFRISYFPLNRHPRQTHKFKVMIGVMEEMVEEEVYEDGMPWELSNHLITDYNGSKELQRVQRVKLMNP